jgi:hypothetical protein
MNKTYKEELLERLDSLVKKIIIENFKMEFNNGSIKVFQIGEGEITAGCDHIVAKAIVMKELTSDFKMNQELDSFLKNEKQKTIDNLVSKYWNELEIGTPCYPKFNEE